MLLQRESKFYVESRRRQFGSALASNTNLSVDLWMVDAPAAPVLVHISGLSTHNKRRVWVLGYYPDQSFRT